MKVMGGVTALAVTPAAVPEANAATLGSAGASGWTEALDRALQGSAKTTEIVTAPGDRLKQLSELIRLQMDVCRHQVQVELVSKVAESGVASVRKLQQAQ